MNIIDALWDLPDDILFLISNLLGPVCRERKCYVPRPLLPHVTYCSRPHAYVFHTNTSFKVCLLPYEAPYEMDPQLLLHVELIINEMNIQLLYKRCRAFCVHFDHKLPQEHYIPIRRLVNNLGLKFSHFCCDGSGVMACISRS